MSVDRRRAGFRLPWTAEGEETDGEQAAADAEVDEMPPPDSPIVPAADASTTNDPAVDVTAVSTPEGAPATLAAPEGESTEFLRDLVGAMRGVAETSRDASLAELRTAIDARLEALATQAAEMESDLRRRAELDLGSVADWERTEIERVRSESEHKRETRRAQLEQQLSEHHNASERDAEATRSRLAEHERDLAAFFAQLGEITDPAAFVAAAKRMPRAPELAGTLPPAAAHPADDPRLAAMGTSPEANVAMPELPTSATTEAATATSDVAPEDAPATPTATADDVAAEPAAEPPAEVLIAPENESENPDSRLAERLAQLDERLSGATQPVSATAPTTANGNGDASTAIVVKGLGSFGAITSFKQALERVEGVRGVTLSLGPTGEFVYRASHAEDFDLVAAIHSIEGPTATIEDTDGTLVVTLSRAR
jgi:hypothetical protein